jgi:hypothetical protein
MPDLTAKRTLVKSPPELWEELSEVEGLAKHLGAFGEIKITKLEPEHTVAWEGEHASGTVSIEPSGWGTKVTLHAELPEVAEAEAVPGAEDEPEPEPESIAESAPEPTAEEPEAEPIAEEPEPEPIVEPPAPAGERRGFWGWLFRRRMEYAVSVPEPVAEEPVAEESVPEPISDGPAPEPAPVAEEAVAEEVVEESVAVAVEAEPVAEEPVLEEPPAPEDPAVDPERARLILDEALDALGAAHHRPFSRG